MGGEGGGMGCGEVRGEGGVAGGGRRGGVVGGAGARGMWWEGLGSELGAGVEGGWCAFRVVGVVVLLVRGGWRGVVSMEVVVGWVGCFAGGGVIEQTNNGLRADLSEPKEGTLENMLIWAQNRKNDDVGKMEIPFLSWYKLELGAANDTEHAVVIVFDEPATELLHCSVESLLEMVGEVTLLGAEENKMKRSELEDSDTDEVCGPSNVADGCKAD
ncbi:hypothetical protein Tco_0972418 [Tanacetum coccineum]